MLELFEERLPATAAELAAGQTGLAEGVSLYHMLLEGVVFDAGQQALLDDLADGALPGVREGVERVERDERWHVGFGLRCLVETQPSADILDDLLERAAEAAAAWGDAVPVATRERSARKVAHRLHVAGLTRIPRGRVATPAAPDRATNGAGFRPNGTVARKGCAHRSAGIRSGRVGAGRSAPITPAGFTPRVPESDRRGAQ